MTEQQIQTNIIKYLESIDAYVVKVVSASKSGVPDLLCCYEGRFIAIEVKKPESRNTVTKLQSYNLDMVEKSGGISFVAWSKEYVEEQILALHRGEL